MWHLVEQSPDRTHIFHNERHSTPAWPRDEEWQISNPKAKCP